MDTDFFVRQAMALPEYDNHAILECVFDNRGQLRGVIAIHRLRGDKVSIGGSRCVSYASETDAIRDVLGLSRQMTYKNALAGLPYGGAKGVILWDDGASEAREALLKRWCSHINKLEGKFLTSFDAGIEQEDIQIMARETPHVVGLGEDPSPLTAQGVLVGIEASLGHVFGSEDLAGRSIAIQGIGHVGKPLAQMLVKRGAIVTVADWHVEKCKNLQQQLPDVKIVAGEEIHQQKVDVFAPCALSYYITPDRVGQLQCPIVAGAANNQLLNAETAHLLHKRHILHAPDYVINAGGLICVMDEYENGGKPDLKRVSARVQQIKKTLRDIFAESQKTSTPPTVVTEQMARKIVG